MKMEDKMEFTKKLIIRLKEIYNSKDFVLGVLANAPHMEDHQTILDFIDKHDWVTDQTLIVLSLQLGKLREKHQKKVQKEIKLAETRIYEPD